MRIARGVLSNIFVLVVFAGFAVLLGILFGNADSGARDPGSSPLATPTSVEQSPLATPTPPPTLPFPTMTPWIPPTAQARTPTPLPLPQPAQNSAGRLFYRAKTQLSDGSLASLLFEGQMDARGSVSQPFQRLLFQPPPGMSLPANHDFSMWFSRLEPSPTGRYLAGISETETGEAVSIIDTLTLGPTLPGDGWLNWTSSRGRPQSASGFFYGWHPNDYEFLFREENAPDRGLWLVNARTGQHRLIAQLPTLDISGAAISPDGQRLAYATNTFDVHQIWTANADGSEPHLLRESNTIVYVFSWSPDGRYLLYTGEPTSAVGKGTPTPNLGGPLWIMDRGGNNHKPLNVPFVFGFGFKPVWSPTSQSVASVGRTDENVACWQKGDAFLADPLCVYKGTGVYVENVGTGDLRLVARNAIDPVWSPDGSLLAVSQMDERQQVDTWLVDNQGHNPQRLTDTPEVDRYPMWLQP